MLGTESSIFRFDDVEVREREFGLTRSGEFISVEPKAFRALLILLRNSGKVITKDELLHAVWGDAAVTENSLARSIALLRRLLADDIRNPSYIETVATVGYRFICKVELSEDPSRVPAIANEQSASVNVTSPRTKFILKSGAVAGGIAALFLSSLIIQRIQHKVPVVSDIVRLTNDRKAKIPINGAVTDGVHLYFMEEGPSGSGIAQVSILGGETTWIPTTLKNGLAILDISPDKSKLLLVAGVGDSNLDDFWVQPLPAGTPRRVQNLKASGLYWTPDGSHFIYCYQHKIGIVNEDGTDPHTIAEITGSAGWFRYSPDGRRIRFSLLQDLGNSSALWEMNANGTNLHQLLPHWNEALDQCCGRWSSDGNYYFLTGSFFLGGGSGSQGIWVIPDHSSLFHRDFTPTRLTTGPLRFGAPTPSNDGKRIFAVGDESRVELFSYDAQSQRFDSYLSGLSAGPVVFSPDGKWMAYVSYPEMDLWKSRTDLSEKVQLTFPPIRAYLPRWSPDASQIAFDDIRPHRAWKVYKVSASGGDSPIQIARSDTNDVDTDPTWTPDGKAVIFARAPSGDRIGQAIYRIDLSTGELARIPGSNGLFSPRISSDGRYIAAMSRDAKELTVLDQTTNSWSRLATGDHFGFNEWSPDGKYVYSREDGGGFAKIVRIRTKDHVMEDVLSLKGFPELVDPFAEWYGFTSDGKLLLMRDRSVQEMYALTLEH